MSGTRNRFSRRVPFQQRHYQSSPHPQQNQNENRASTKISRINALLSRIRDESDSVYARRTSCVTQLSNILSETLTPGESAQVFDAATYGIGNTPGLELVFEDTRAPANFKLLVAKCIANIATISENNLESFFRWIFERLHASGSGVKEKERERKLWLLISLRESITRVTQSSNNAQNIVPYSTMQQLIPNILSELENLLDSAECVDYFSGLLEVLERIADRYPTEFENRFQDIIDLLVGWHVDTTVPESLHNYISDSFRRLRSFWAQNLNFAHELLSHFLADMEVVAGITVSQDGPQIDQKTHTDVDGVPSNLKGLLGCFHAVAETIGPIVPANSQDEVHGVELKENAYPYDRLRAYIVKFLVAVGKLYMDIDFFNKGNQIILALSTHRKATFVQQQPKSTEFWLIQIKYVYQVSYSSQNMEEWFDSYLQTLAQWFPYVHPDVAITLMNPESPLMKLRHHCSFNARLFSDFLDMFRCILRNSNSITTTQDSKPSAIQLTHQLVSEMRSMCEIILNSNSTSDKSDAEIRWQLKSMNVIMFNYKKSDEFREEFQHIFSENYHSSNEGIGKYKNLHGLVMYSVIKAAHQISRSQKYFIQLKESISFESSTFDTMLLIIDSIFSYNNKLPMNLIMFSIEWLRDIFEFCRSDKQSLNDKKKDHVQLQIGQALLSLLHLSRVIQNPDVSVQIPKVIQDFIDVFGSLNLPKKIFPLIAERINDSNPQIQKEFLKVFYEINPLLAVFKYDYISDPSLQMSRASICALPNLGNFRPQHFQIIMTYLGMKELLSSSAEEMDSAHTMIDMENDVQWRQRLLHACQSMNVNNNTTFDEALMTSKDHNNRSSLHHDEISGLIDNSDDLITFWTLWETARYCVLSRLRTPFGGPQQTFDAFEKKLNDFMTGNLNLTLNTTNISDESLEPIYTKLNQLHNLLIFINCLEMQIYNAAVGTSLGNLPQAPRGSIIFFRTNRKVCDDWFSRVRATIAKGAGMVGNDAILITHGLQFLADRVANMRQGIMKERIIAFQEMLMIIVQAMRRLHSVDSIHGLLIWSKKIFHVADKDLGNLPENSSSSQISNKNVSQKMPGTSSQMQSEQQGSPHTLLQRNILHRNHTNMPNYMHFEWMNCALLFAKAKYEQSAKESINILNRLLGYDHAEDKLTSLQIFDCYCQMDDLKSLSQWLSQQNSLENLLTPLHQVNQQYLKALSQYGKEDKSFLDAWETIKSTEPKIPDHFELLHDVPFLSFLHHFRADLAQMVRQEDSQIEINHSYEQSAFSIMKLPIRFALKESLDSALPMLVIAQNNKSDIKEHQKFVNEFPTSSSSFSRHFVQDLGIWSPLKRLVDKTVATDDLSEIKDSSLIHSPQIDISKLLIAKIARKTEVLDLASNVCRYTGDDSNNIRTEYVFEQAKILYAQGKPQNAVRHVCQILEKTEQEYKDLLENPLHNLTLQQVFLKLAKWIGFLQGQLPGDLSKGIENYAMKYLQTTSEQKIVDSISNNDANMKNIELCLWSAVQGEHSYGKAWYSYATYFYKKGWRILEEIHSGKMTLSFLCDLRQTIQNSLIDDWQQTNIQNSADYDSLLKMIFRVFIRRFGTRSISDNFDVKESEFRPLEPWISNQTKEEIKQSFNKITKEILQAFNIAADGYFQFLKSMNNENANNVGDQKDPLSKSIKEADTMTATLRILKLLVTYGSYMKESLSEAFEDTVVTNWEFIIPQLFSRLDHPESFVRQQICNLLCKIATSSPQSIVYHTVVALNSNNTNEQTKQSLQSIASSLDVSNGVLIAEIRRVIQELRRITVLWEELWLNKIAGLQLDVNKRLHKVGKELERINDKLNLTSDQKTKIMRESYDAIMKPVISSLERLYNVTSADPTTPHEIWFAKLFGERIREAFDRLRSPRSWDNTKEGWNLFKNIHKDLTKELQTNRSLKLADVAPYLATIKSSAITMPGLPTNAEHITIQSFDQTVFILPTKTKPKKLSLLGSDGHLYGYLFKGLEDLHLDERIMQLIQVTNKLYKRDKQASSRNLSARHYAVIPLGEHSGMIQWVENATQMFSLYKKWQHREHFARMLLSNAGEKSPAIPQRPSDMFFEKIGKALKKEGLPISTSRRNWPHSILKTVFLELLSETPADLLEKELWTSCTSSSEWWQKSISLSRSLAVMSVVGYIIGLGDRHLDNILIDFNAGEVIHIDYNVCFEKGRKLRVPEIVPFRLTQNIEKALGITGVEGVFRIACETALKVMRKNKEMLIILLEAFVYDPLVDWHHEVTIDRDKQIMELEEHLSLLTSRIAELKHPLEMKHKQLTTLLSEFITLFQILPEHHSTPRDLYEDSANQSITLEDPEKKNTPIAENSVEIEGLKTTLTQRAAECRLWHAQHESSIQSIQGNLIQVIYNEVISSSSQFRVSIFTPVISIITTNEALAQQCSHTDQELFNWVTERNNSYTLCIEHLQYYRALTAPVVPILMAQDYYSKWPQLLAPLLESNLQRDGFETVFQTVQREVQIDSELIEIRERLKASCEDITRQGVSIGESFNLVSVNMMTENEPEQSALLETFFHQIAQAQDEDGSSSLGIYGFISFLSQLKQDLDNNDNEKEVLKNLGFNDTLQTAISNALFSELFNDPKFITNYVAFFALYNILYMATVTTPKDELIPRIYSIVGEYLQLIKMFYTLQASFESVLLPRIFEILKIMPIAFQPYVDILYDLSTDTFNYWEMKHPEAHSVVANMIQTFSQIRASVQQEDNLSTEISNVISVFDEMFKELEIQICHIQTLFNEPLPFPEDQKCFKNEYILDDFTVHKFNIIANVLLGCQDYFKENFQSHISPNTWLSSIAISQIFVANSDSLSRLRQIVQWCMSDLFIPTLQTLLSTTLNHFKGLVASDNLPKGAKGNDDDVENASSSTQELVPGDGSFWRENLDSMKEKIKKYMFLGSKINLLNLINTRKTQIEIEAQQRKMELMRFEWINQKYLGGSALVHTQILENFTRDVNKFMQLELLLQKIIANYQEIQSEASKQISAYSSTSTTAASNEVVLQSFGDAIANQQILFAQELQRIKHVIALCNSLIHLETFRNVSEKTKAMDTDTLNLVRMYEIAVMGTDGEKEEAHSGQFSQNKALNFSDTEHPQKLQNLAKEFHDAFDEFRVLMIELVPLIELVTSIDSDAEETIKEARLKAKESLGSWSKLDAESDSVMNSALALLDENFRAGGEGGLLLKAATQSETASTPTIESVSVSDRLHSESIRALSEIKDILSHLFKLLSSLGNLDLENAQHDSGDQIG
ncbi:2074_t:CDS:10, partial [Ambispora leptoticha]